jgi:hypothetical protein
MPPNTLPDDDENQTKCYTGNHGWEYMEDCYDTFPPAVRRRLRNSPYNLCAGCLEAFFYPKVQRAHPRWTDEQAYLRAIAVMEYKVQATVRAGKWQ